MYLRLGKAIVSGHGGATRGERCVYPGTDEPFELDAEGSGRFLFVTFGGSIDIDGEIDARHYELAATDVGGGAWRIERVGGGVTGGGAGAPLALHDLEFRGESDGTAIHIEGIVQARASLSSVVLTGRVDGGIVDVTTLARLSANEVAPFVLRGAARSGPGEFRCAIDVEYFDIGALGHGQSLGTEWQGRRMP